MVGRLLAVGMAVAVVVSSNLSLAGAPDFEVLSGSTVTAVGAVRPIPLQTLDCTRAWQPGFQIAATDSLILPQIGLGLGEFIQPMQHQGFRLALNPSTGQATAEFELWLQDSDGNRVELTTTLTTGTPATRNCNNFPYCFGSPSDPAHCDGAPWDPTTGEIRLVGITLVPQGSGTFIDCQAIVFVIEGHLARGDADGDGIEDALDNCPDADNASQSDSDGDGVGTLCDNCPSMFNPGQRDQDDDGTGSACQPLLINFQPLAAPVPPGWLPDGGGAFSPANCYGWITTNGLQTRDRNVNSDQLLDTIVFSSAINEWEACAAGGEYRVTVSVGDAAFAQGPHVVTLEGQPAIESQYTSAGQHIEETLEHVFVGDGRLTMEIGGGGGGVTAVNYIAAIERGDQPFFARHVNFQPAASPVPPGFDIDTGALFDPAQGHGWNTTVTTRDRNVIEDPALDTLAFTNAGALATWNLEVPPDFYRVEISMGDSAFMQGPQMLVVEGQTWAMDLSTGAGGFVKLSGNLFVLDGDLTLDLGQPGGNSTINYVTIVNAPADLDGDGVGTFADNCPETVNPDQLDSDGDHAGNLCDADDDDDGFLDEADCAPTQGMTWLEPVEVDDLRVDGVAPSLVTWPDQEELEGIGNATYDVVTQSLSNLRDTQSFAEATCLGMDLALPEIEDGRMPEQDAGFLYLVRMTNACGAGSYGSGVGAGSPDPRASLDATSPCP